VCSSDLIVTRILWLMAHTIIARWIIHHFDKRIPFLMRLPTFRGAFIVSWCGMRGIVTLAAALALPSGASAFPYRDLIVLCAFAVVLTTLVLQGLTLRWLIERVGLRDDGMVEREIGIARAETARVALRELASVPSLPCGSLREEYEARRRSGEKQSNGSTIEQASTTASLQRRVVDAQRHALMDLRARDVIGDAAFHAAEEELDLLELTADPRIRPE